MKAKKSAKKSQYCIHSFCFNKAAAFLLFFRFLRCRRGCSSSPGALRRNMRRFRSTIRWETRDENEVQRYPQRGSLLLKITTKLSTNSLVTQKCFAARRLSAVLLLTFANAITKNQQNSQMAVKLTLKMWTLTSFFRSTWNKNWVWPPALPPALCSKVIKVPLSLTRTFVPSDNTGFIIVQTERLVQ